MFEEVPTQEAGLQLGGISVDESKTDRQDRDGVGLAPAGYNTSTAKSLRFEEAGLKEATIVWKGLNKFVDTENGPKQILFGINGVAKSGQLIALMGPSGSGKTTLLNVLGGRALANLTGDVFINNIKYKKSMRRTIAYVLQEDIFYTNLTVRQQLYFTSHLRLPDKLSREEKKEAVDQIISTLRMERCADTQISLISGGEKKRTNIGTELLTNPSILLLDEPTSGLDSTAANALVATLRQLAGDRMTVLTSIHQPSSKVFYAFDKLILMADGHMVYYGPPSKCLSYLNSGVRGLTYAPPMDYNPADFIMDLVTNTVSQGEGGDKTAVGEGGADVEAAAERSVRTILIEAWDDAPILDEIARTTQELSKNSQSPTEKGSEGEGEEDGVDITTVKYLASYKTQFKVLLERAALNSKSSILTPLAILQCVAIAVITGAMWWQMKNGENQVDDRSGFIFFFMTYWFFVTLFSGMMQFLPERTIILKERASGSYRLSAYYLSKILSEAPVRLIMPFVFLCISYPMAALNSAPSAFFAIVGTQLLAALAGESCGLFIGTLTMDFEKPSNPLLLHYNMLIYA